MVASDERDSFWFKATVDREDTSDAILPVMDALNEIQGEQELPIYVVTDKPREKVETEIKAQLEELRANPPPWLRSRPGRS